jgi:hypothetical protein
VYQALAIAPPSDLYSMAALNGTQFTLQVMGRSCTSMPHQRSSWISAGLALSSVFGLWAQMWIDWEDTYKPGDANSSAAGVGFGLLGVAQVWRWYLQRTADGHSR